MLPAAAAAALRPPWWRAALIWICAGLGSGFSPWAPGTAGSLAGLAAGAALLGYSRGALLAAALVCAGLGYAAIRGAVRGAEADADPGWIVIDEVAGQMLALLPARSGRVTDYLLAFLLFRAFDILKPGPVGRADRLGGAFGIMADDVIAGGLAALCLWVLRIVFR